MQIPEKFKAILAKDQNLHGLVLNIASAFEPIYKDNKLFFFEEYTDHGIEHVERVLSASEVLIDKNTLDELSPKDIAILIFGAILHDIGMHIELSTFNHLLNGDYDEYMCSTLDEHTWSQLWAIYISEIKRLSSKQKNDIFGNEQYCFREPDVSNKDNLSGSDKKLIGEFIRRHHARISHEFALAGIYGVDDQVIKFGDDNLNKLHRKLSGILARSHGMSIRDTFPYLKEIACEGWRNPDDIKIIFLMAVLRIADYIQIDSSRTNLLSLKLKTFSSPISKKEHCTHLSITSLSFNQPDSENIFVLCEPESSEMLIKIDTLINEIQRELDTSWAVLGEVYGFLHNHNLALNFRRITSNLKDKAFLSTLDYVPEKFEFIVNNELSKLLVAPLYGDNPSYGVRELIQNAVDACIERQHIESKQNVTYSPKICVTVKRIDSERSIFTIEDNGKGMSLMEIKHYFLNVGGSFRHSLNWKKSFQDDQGKTKVCRNGKFGIGVLASFLLGDQMTVETVHFEEQTQYIFETEIDSDFIEIQRSLNSNRLGTKISIQLNNDRRESLLKSSWINWYIFSEPQIEFYVDGDQIINGHIIDRSDHYTFRAKQFSKIEWKYGSYDYQGRFDSNIITCNGIYVPHTEAKFKQIETKNKRSNSPQYIIENIPNLLIEDKEGILPLKLDRNSFDTPILPFQSELITEISKHFIAKILTHEFEVSSELQEERIYHFNIKMLRGKHGFTLNSDYFANKFIGKYDLIHVIVSHWRANINLLKENSLLSIGYNSPIKLTYSEDYVAPKTYGANILLRSDIYKNLFLSDKNRITKTAKNTHKKLSENENYTSYLYNSVESPVVEDYRHFFERNNDPYSFGSSIQSIQHVTNFPREVNGGEILNSLFEKYFGENILIPYDMGLRKQIYSNAFDDLKDYF